MESQGLSANSLSTYLVVVRKFFEWLEGMKLYPNVAKGVKGGKSARGFRKDCLTRDQAVELLAGIDRSTLLGKHDFALLNLLIRTGLRTIEVVRADVGDIRQEGGEARLLVQGKGRDSKDDFVLLTQAVLKPLRLYLQAQRPVGELTPLFASLSDRNIGCRLTTRTIRRIVKDRLRSIGLDSNRLTAHSLRHTAVTFALRGGASIQDAQAMARHASINTTMVYSHNVDRFEKAGERKVDAWLDS
jgi:integrase/recombinase XerC/integrase/recombinase XerD